MGSTSALHYIIHARVYVMWSSYMSMSWHCRHLCVQAWAFASYARKLLGKAPAMNMLLFDRAVWVLHRRLHHRFLKFFTHIEEATKELCDYQDAQESAAPATAARPNASAAAAPSGEQVICLLSADSDASDDETEEDEWDVFDYYRRLFFIIRYHLY